MMLHERGMLRISLRGSSALALEKLDQLVQVVRLGLTLDLLFAQPHRALTVTRDIIAWK